MPLELVLCSCCSRVMGLAGTQVPCFTAWPLCSTCLPTHMKHCIDLGYDMHDAIVAP
mgnify:CR=1 FL=1